MLQYIFIKTCHCLFLVACVAAGRGTQSRYSPSAKRLPKACSDIPQGRICVFFSDWLFSYAPHDWSYSCEIYHAMLKINIVACKLYIGSTFVQSFALHFKSLKRLCLIRPFIVIYAVASSKRETKECYFQRDGNNSTYSPRLKVWKYLCDVNLFQVSTVFSLLSHLNYERSARGFFPFHFHFFVDASVANNFTAPKRDKNKFYLSSLTDKGNKNIIKESHTC